MECIIKGKFAEILWGVEEGLVKERYIVKVECEGVKYVYAQKKQAIHQFRAIEKKYKV